MPEKKNLYKLWTNADPVTAENMVYQMKTVCNEFYSILVITLVVFCATSAQAACLHLNWEASGFAMPESVFASSEHEWLYVSNVNGKKRGFISRLAKDGTIETLKWVAGLNSPTGMGLYGGKLYVADQNRLHVIDVKSGKLVTSIVSPEAKALNDVTISEKGQVFVSDIFGGRIYALQNNELTTWLNAPELPYPNGILAQHGSLIVANWGGSLTKDLNQDDFGSLYRVNMADKSITLIPASYKLGRLDGVASANNGLLASHHLSGELYLITDKERILLETFTPGLADIGSDGEYVYTPFLTVNTVRSYKLEKN